MVLVLAIAVFIWGLGHLLGLPRNARGLMIALLYVAVLAVHIVFPEGHALRGALGGSLGEWVSIGFLGSVVWVYSVGLKRLRKRVRPENQPNHEDAPTSSELERNARHIVLREMGGPGQKRLKSARVLVVGAGCIGSPSLQYLAFLECYRMGQKRTNDKELTKANLDTPIFRLILEALHATLSKNPL